MSRKASWVLADGKVEMVSAWLIQMSWNPDIIHENVSAGAFLLLVDSDLSEMLWRAVLTEEETTAE